jgi:hypothetical protein
VGKWAWKGKKDQHFFLLWFRLLKLNRKCLHTDIASTLLIHKDTPFTRTKPRKQMLTLTLWLAAFLKYVTSRHVGWIAHKFVGESAHSRER